MLLTLPKLNISIAIITGNGVEGHVAEQYNRIKLVHSLLTLITYVHLLNVSLQLPRHLLRRKLSFFSMKTYRLSLNTTVFELI